MSGSSIWVTRVPIPHVDRTETLVDEKNRCLIQCTACNSAKQGFIQSVLSVSREGGLGELTRASAVERKHGCHESLDLKIMSYFKCFKIRSQPKMRGVCSCRILRDLVMYFTSF